MYKRGVSIEQTHKKILEFLNDDTAMIAVIVSATYFEWILRRAIIALGTNPNRTIREKVFGRRSGLTHFKKIWKQEVQSHLGKGLPDIVSTWPMLVRKGGMRRQAPLGAYQLRNKLVHGIDTSPSAHFAEPHVRAFLHASKDLVNLAQDQGINLFQRLPIRRNPRRTK